MAKRFFYSGDINLEHGGFFYTVSDVKNGFSDVVRVTPFSDAGGQDNGFWIDILTVNIPEDAEKLNSILSVIGSSVDSLPKGAARKHEIIYACVASGAFEVYQVTSVQIGKNDSFARKIMPVEFQLSANWKLENYVRKNFLRNI